MATLGWPENPQVFGKQADQLVGVNHLGAFAAVVREGDKMLWILEPKGNYVRSLLVIVSIRSSVTTSDAEGKKLPDRANTGCGHHCMWLRGRSRVAIRRRECRLLTSNPRCMYRRLGAIYTCKLGVGFQPRVVVIVAIERTCDSCLLTTRVLPCHCRLPAECFLPSDATMMSCWHHTILLCDALAYAMAVLSTLPPGCPQCGKQFIRREGGFS